MGSLNGSPEVSAKEAGLRVAVRKVLREYAIDVPENQGLHGWRCQYPDRYPPCTHFSELVDDLVKAVMGR